MEWIWNYIQHMASILIKSGISWKLNEHLEESKRKKKLKLLLFNYSLQASKVNDNSIWSVQFRFLYTSSENKRHFRHHGIVQIKFIFICVKTLFFLNFLLFILEWKNKPVELIILLFSGRIKICYLWTRTRDSIKFPIQRQQYNSFEISLEMFQIVW